jgi:site-specific DNA-methyltransferase (adenine-specific)
MEVMKRYPNHFFELAIIDPPYGINAPKMQMGTNLSRTKGGYPGESTAAKVKKLGTKRLNGGSGKLKNRLLNTSIIEWDNQKPTAAFFDELFRVSKNQIIWGGNYFDLPPTRCFIVWNKNQPWENFSQAELAWTSFDGPAKLFTYSNRGGKNEVEKFHPTEKPIYLYDYCLKHFSKPGFKILDTHGGSCNSRISAFRKGLYYVGCEIDKYYFDKQEQRFMYATKQVSMAFPA